MIPVCLAVLVFAWLLFGIRIVSFGFVLLAAINRRQDINYNQKSKINYIFILGFVGWLVVFIRLSEILIYY